MMPEIERTMTVTEIPAELQEPGAVLTSETFDVMREQLRGATHDYNRIPRGLAWSDTARTARDVESMWVIPSRYEGVDVEAHVPATLMTRAMPAQAERPPGELERSRTGQPIVEVDLNGTSLSQSALDEIYSRVSAAKMLYPGEAIDINVRRVNVTQMLRLIVDTGYIYELLVKMIDEKESNG